MDFPEEDKDLDTSMNFNEPDLDAISSEPDVLEDGDLLEVPPELGLDKGKSKQQSQQNILKTRRNIEDYFERKRLRQELDYLEEDDK